MGDGEESLRNRIKRFFEIKKDGTHFLSRFECLEPVMGDGEESCNCGLARLEAPLLI